MLELLKKLTPPLLAIEKKYFNLKTELAKPENSNNIKLLTELTKQLNLIEKVYNLYQKVKKQVDELSQLKEGLGENDPEFVQTIRNEIIDIEQNLKTNINQLQIELLPRDPNDDKNVIVEIRGAAGGDEANIFAGDLFRMYHKYFEGLKGFKVELMGAHPSSGGGFSYVSFAIKGPKAYSLLKWESGSHRVQRIPVTESKGRVHTSTATVLVMPEANEVDITIKPSDLRIDTFRSSGAGGQHVNTTDSAIRITHLPTGIVAQSQDGRSQHKNKDIAMTLLQTKIYDLTRQQEQEKRGKEAKAKIGSGDRSEKIRTYNFPQNRLTDHRINLSLNNLDKILEGDLEGVIKALLAEEKKAKILESIE